MDEQDPYAEPENIVLERKDNRGAQWLVEYNDEVAIQVLVKSKNDSTQSHLCKVTSGELVKDLRDQVADKLHVSAQSVKLEFQHALLRDNQTCDEAKLYDGASISLILQDM